MQLNFVVGRGSMLLGIKQEASCLRCTRQVNLLLVITISFNGGHLGRGVEVGRWPPNILEDNSLLF